MIPATSYIRNTYIIQTLCVIVIVALLTVMSISFLYERWWLLTFQSLNLAFIIAVFLVQIRIRRRWIMLSESCSTKSR